MPANCNHKCLLCPDDVQPAADGDSALPPLPPYELLEQRAGSAADGGQPLLKMEGGKRRFKALMYNFQNSGAVKNQALALYVNNQVSPASLIHARNSCPIRRCAAKCCNHIVPAAAGAPHTLQSLPFFVAACPLAAVQVSTSHTFLPLRLPLLQLFKRAFLEFKEFLVAAMDEQLWRCLGQLQPREGSQALFPYFARFVTERYAQEIKAYRSAHSTAAADACCGSARSAGLKTTRYENCSASA